MTIEPEINRQGAILQLLIRDNAETIQQFLGTLSAALEFYTIAEPLKVVDVITILIASISMVVVAITLLLIMYIGYRLREDVRFMDKISDRMDKIDRKNEEGDYISDQVTNVLYDLYALVSSLKCIHELENMGYGVNEKLFDAMELDVLRTEKHFAEIGLLSVDKERRMSAQQSLANLSGDFDSLRIMRGIADKRFGIYDVEIVKSIRQIENRIARIVIDSSRWTGRPSGGAF